MLNRDTELLCVFCGAEIGGNPGSAIGATTAWQLVLRLPREPFADLLIIIAARQLAEVNLLLEGLIPNRVTRNPSAALGDGHPGV